MPNEMPVHVRVLAPTSSSIVVVRGSKRVTVSTRDKPAQPIPMPPRPGKPGSSGIGVMVSIHVGPEAETFITEPPAESKIVSVSGPIVDLDKFNDAIKEAHAYGLVLELRVDPSQR